MKAHLSSGGDCGLRSKKWAEVRSSGHKWTQRVEFKIRNDAKETETTDPVGLSGKNKERGISCTVTEYSKK